MPIHEFKCPSGHVTEQFFKTFADAEGVWEIECPAACQEESTGDTVPCGDGARRIDSVPGHPICYGQGFYKPAASGATSYTRSDPSKAAAEVIDEIGPKNLVQGVKANSK